MGAPVELSQQARRDLREIGEFIARNNPHRARTFRRELLLKARNLGDHPRMGRIFPERGDEAIREIVYGAYRIIYQVIGSSEAIFILRFWHAARGHPQIVED